MSVVNALFYIARTGCQCGCCRASFPITRRCSVTSMGGATDGTLERINFELLVHARGTGIVNSVDAAAHKVRLTHGPIPKGRLAGYDHGFPVARLRQPEPGPPQPTCQLRHRQDPDGTYQIQSLEPAGAVNEHPPHFFAHGPYAGILTWARSHRRCVQRTPSPSSLLAGPRLQNGPATKRRDPHMSPLQAVPAYTLLAHPVRVSMRA
jgi:hypothetical protein